jgi:hypothetical protein
MAPLTARPRWLNRRSSSLLRREPTFSVETSRKRSSISCSRSSSAREPCCGETRGNAHAASRRFACEYFAECLTDKRIVVDDHDRLGHTRSRCLDRSALQQHVARDPPLNPIRYGAQKRGNFTLQHRPYCLSSRSVIQFTEARPFIRRSWDNVRFSATFVPHDRPLARFPRYRT